MSFVLIGAKPAQAQLEARALVGVNFSKVSFNPDFAEVTGFDSASSNFRTGFVAGVSLRRPLSEMAGLQIEGLIARTGAKVEGRVAEGGDAFSFEQDVRLTQFEIPILVNVPIGAARRARVHAGPFIGFKLSQSETVRETFNGETDEDEVDEEDESDVKSTDFGLAFGAEVDVTRSIGFGGRFNLGLINIDDETDSEFKSIKTRGGRIYVTISWR